jgi:hypothetical protein
VSLKEGIAFAWVSIKSPSNPHYHIIIISTLAIQRSRVTLLLVIMFFWFRSLSPPSSVRPSVCRQSKKMSFKWPISMPLTIRRAGRRTRRRKRICLDFGGLYAYNFALCIHSYNKYVNEGECKSEWELAMPMNEES